MLKVNTRGGKTLTYDLSCQDGIDRWNEDRLRSSFQRSITGIGIYLEDTLHALPMPQRFKWISFTAEPIVSKEGEFIGEKISCQVDEILFDLAVYKQNGRRQHFVRANLKRVGRVRGVPPGKPRVVVAN